jgi:hypothetical protein
MKCKRNLVFWKMGATCTCVVSVCMYVVMEEAEMKERGDGPLERAKETKGFIYVSPLMGTAVHTNGALAPGNCTLSLVLFVTMLYFLAFPQHPAKEGVFLLHRHCPLLPMTRRGAARSFRLDCTRCNGDVTSRTPFKACALRERQNPPKLSVSGIITRCH